MLLVSIITCGSYIIPLFSGGNCYNHITQVGAYGEFILDAKVVANLNLEPLKIMLDQNKDINNSEFLIHNSELFPHPGWHDRPYDTTTHHVYTRDNQRLFIQRETGFLVTGDGRPVASGNTQNHQPITPTNRTANGHGNVLKSVPNSSELIDSANRNLPIFLNSTLDRAFLRSSDGRNYVTSIARGNEVFLINFRPNPNRPDDTMLIFAFRERVQRAFWDRAFNPRLWGRSNRYYYQFFDMAGRAIEERYVATFEDTPAWQQALYFAGLIAASIIFPPLLIFTIGSAVTGGIEAIPFVEIVSRTTLGELLDEINSTP